jgi:hypothetical protein
MTTGVRSGWIGNCMGSLNCDSKKMGKIEQMTEHLIAAIRGLEAMIHNSQAKTGLK